MNSNVSKRRFQGCLPGCLVAALIGVFLARAFIYPIIQHANSAALTSTYCQYSSDIGRSLDQYATDHNGKYPEGKSSTEIFQKLIDKGYVTDPSIFYCPLPGKIKAEGKSRLRENLSNPKMSVGM